MKNGDALKKILTEGPLPCAFLISALDNVRKERALSLLASRCLGPHDQPVYLRGEALTLSLLRSIEDDMYSLSLFSSQKLFVIRDTDKIKATEASALAECIGRLNQRTPQGVTIALLGKDLLKGNALFKKFEELGTGFSLGEITGDDLSRWVLKELSRHGVSRVGSDLPSTLIRLTEGDLDTLTSKIEHLALFAEEGTIKSHEVYELFGSRSVADEFELLSFLAQGKRDLAQVRITTLLRQDKSAFLLLGLLSKNITQFFALRSLLDRGFDPETIAQHLKIPSWLAKKQIPFARRYNPESLTRALSALIRADSKLKNRSLGPESIMSELIDSLIPG